MGQNNLFKVLTPPTPEQADLGNITISTGIEKVLEAIGYEATVNELETGSPVILPFCSIPDDVDFDGLSIWPRFYVDPSIKCGSYPTGSPESKTELAVASQLGLMWDGGAAGGPYVTSVHSIISADYTYINMMANEFVQYVTDGPAGHERFPYFAKVTGTRRMAANLLSANNPDYTYYLDPTTITTVWYDVTLKTFTTVVDNRSIVTAVGASGRALAIVFQHNTNLDARLVSVSITPYVA